MVLDLTVDNSLSDKFFSMQGRRASDARLSSPGLSRHCVLSTITWLASAVSIPVAWHKKTPGRSGMDKRVDPQ